MWFWIRNLTLFIILATLAYGIFTKPDFLIRKNSANVAAEGFSDFYSKVRSSISVGVKELSKFKIALPDTSDKLTQLLQQRSRVVVPGDVNWRGTVVDRRFRDGETVKNKLTEFAQAEGIALFWTLPRDYVVKQYFQTETTLIETIHEIAVAIAPDFQSPVLAFYCPRERAAVITDKINAHLQQYCMPANTPPMRD
ncbi:TcpQ domain-containing protein [Rheinheimera metallidurans]|uniref:TcpQ domain-containing protein n=1 Tax=Rheinheimera metallidurans TaxID=2925781 RepID=UPI003002A13E